MTAATLCVALAVSCTGKQVKGVSKGSKSKFDSLSYAIGTDIVSSLKMQMRDVPFDYKAACEALEVAALDKKPMVVDGDTLTHDRAVGMLREYMMTKRAQRASEIKARKAEADSIALAAGQTPEPVSDDFADPEMFESESERMTLSYALGTDIGNSLKNVQFPLQATWVIEAITDGVDGKGRMTREEASDYLDYYFNKKIPAENRAESEKWLSKIERKSGVKKTESGILYKIEKAGDEEVKAVDDRDVVKVHYKGTLPDGTVFDASRYEDMPAERQEMMRRYRPDNYDENDPVEFPLNRVIRGWTEGMKLVGKGGKITLWIPSELAYGERASMPIGPNRALRFDVELIDVIPHAAPAKKADEQSAE